MQAKVLAESVIELPPLNEIIKYVTLSHEEIKVYESILDEDEL
jgi:SNF2 family DNA or RNA helicase